MEIAPVSPKSLYSPSYSMSTNCWGVQNITLVLQIMQMYHRCIAKYPRNYHYARTSVHPSRRASRCARCGLRASRGPTDRWQLRGAGRGQRSHAAHCILAPSSSAYSARTARDSSGQLWCCSCARCFDATIIRVPAPGSWSLPGQTFQSLVCCTGHHKRNQFDGPVIMSEKLPN